ncbi:hypothetical protein M405DRAFT_938761, partial [Rhizopogon salebrosus TDB-379]
MSVFGFDEGTFGSAVATGKGKNNLKLVLILLLLFSGDIEGFKVLLKIELAPCVARGELGETGHRLVVLGREEELIDGSPAVNVYGTKFIYAFTGTSISSSPTVSSAPRRQTRRKTDLGCFDFQPDLMSPVISLPGTPPSPDI